ARRCSARRVSRLQRRVRGVVGRGAHASRSLRGGDPVGASARRIVAGAGGAWAAGADAAARVTARGAHVRVRGTDSARRSGSLVVKPRTNRGGYAPRGTGPVVAAVWPVYD